MKREGRTRRKVRALLEAQGFIVETLTPAEGHYRTSPYADVYRWEGSGRRDGHSVTFYSWDTMSACARGIKVEADGALNAPRSCTAFLVHALKPAEP